MAQPHSVGRPAMTACANSQGTGPAELYASLYVREFPAQALLRLRPELRGRPCVVLEGEAQVQRVCSLNTAARALGVEQEMTRPEIETFPTVALLRRSGAEEQTTTAALLHCAASFSPRMENRSEGTAFACVIDITGTEKLLGLPEVLAQKILRSARALGICAEVAVSANFHAALCVARGLSSQAPVRIVPAGEEAAALAPLPLSVLDLTPAQAETFALWGIGTLGELARLPERDLIARMGQDGRRLHQLARGCEPHLFVPADPPFSLEERMELDSPVESLESLLFVTGVLLHQLIVRASERGFALASITVVLSLEGGGEHMRTVRPALPTSDRQLWIKLLHLDIEAHPPGAAVFAVALWAEPGSTSKTQLGLFSPQTPEPMRLEVTLARIRAIVGEHAAGRAVLEDSHRPGAFHLEPFTAPPVPSRPEVSVQGEPEGRARAAIRQIRPPEAVFVVLEENRPKEMFFRQRRYAVESAYGPWMTSGEWWTPTLWATEQWDLVARTHEGEPGTLLCCCVVHDLLENRWRVEGLYD